MSGSVDLRLNCLGRFPQTLRHQSRADVGRFGELADFAFPPADKNGSATRALRSLQIGNSIPDHVALCERHVEISSRLHQHTDFGFAAIASFPELVYLRLRVMQTVVDSVDAPASAADLGKHKAFKCLQRLSLEMPLGNSRLIGDHRDTQTQIIQQPDCFRDPRQEFELGSLEWRIDHTCVLMMDQGVDNAIAIEENGFHEFGTSPGPGLCGSFVNEHESFFVIVASVIVSEPAVARDDVKDNLTSFEIEPEFQFAKARATHRFAQASFVFFAVEHEEPAAARTRNFSTDGSILLCEFVPRINLRIGNSLRELLFHAPMYVQQLSKLAQLSFGDRVADFMADVLYLPETGNDRVISISSGLILFL